LVINDVSAGARATISSQIDDINSVEAFTHHFSQPGVRLAGQEFAIGDEGNDTPARCILSFKQLPNCPTPKRYRKLGEGVELISPSGFAHRLLQVSPEIIHPSPDERFVLTASKPSVRRVTEDRQNWRARLDLVGKAAL